MSYTEMFGFNKNGDAYELADISNAWRGAVAVWNHLYSKYFGERFPTFIGTENAFEKLNKAFNDGKMQEHEKIALITTYDNAIIKRENFQEVIEAFRKFEAETSLKEQSDVIEEALKDENCIAIGWNQTSVNGDNWCNFGGYDEEKDESIPYNLNSGEKHWYIFKELEEENHD